MKLNDFYGKNVYITGGSSGIGLSTANKLAAQGANILILARRKKVLEPAVSEIMEYKSTGSQKISFAEIDVSDNGQVFKVLHKAVVDFGEPDVLINSAGASNPSYFENISYDSFDKIIQTNLYGTWNTVSVLVPFMKKKGGRIVNVSSVAGFIGVFGFTAYSASKFGVIGFSEALRSELKSFNIGVSVLCPPDTDTPMLRKENVGKPPETLAISESAKIMSANAVAEALIKGMKKDKFMIVPGFDGKFTFLAKRFVPGIVEKMINRTIKKSQKKR